jgi:purine-binding chemotaxis protein CheW
MEALSHPSVTSLPAMQKTQTIIRPEETAFVTLSIAEQLCGIPVLGVRDVLNEQQITRIPLAPPEIAGNLNLRGRIVTAIDVRRRLHLPPAPAGKRRMAVVAERGNELYALLVDQVHEVLNLSANDFESNPPNLLPNWAAHSAGIYRLKDRLMIVLDIPKLLSFNDQPH